MRKNTREELLNACTKEDFEFKLMLPALASKLTWSFDPSEEDLVQDLPVATPVERNGKTFYEYFYPRTRVFDVAGVRTIKSAAKICIHQKKLETF